MLSTWFNAAFVILHYIGETKRRPKDPVLMNKDAPCYLSQLKHLDIMNAIARSAPHSYAKTVEPLGINKRDEL